MSDSDVTMADGQGRPYTTTGAGGFTAVNQGTKRPAGATENDDDERTEQDRERASKRTRREDDDLDPDMDWLQGLDPNAAPHSADPINRRTAGITPFGIGIGFAGPGPTDEELEAMRARAALFPRPSDPDLMPSMDWLGEDAALLLSPDPINRRSASTAADGLGIVPAAAVPQLGTEDVEMGAGGEEVGGLPPSEQGAGGAPGAGGDEDGTAESDPAVLEAARILMDMHRKDSLLRKHP